ncbi:MULTISPECIES: hypothetical protein [unclassified Streptomyces]|uniref:hypothetical protein n=1 Tax=unclassified Streptomyces TaxID=2593676 RepID=UPI002DDB1229|nr:hypothetical protein [Streptomyces sp. NBC_01795]WSA92156.1 hypothetical protein OIE63_11695 [Streptomyces sp. NBC_01795]WSS44032.1 hypothetical protein OG220_28170 [Streptomyces sp. NBC_01187]
MVLFLCLVSLLTASCVTDGEPSGRSSRDPRDAPELISRNTCSGILENGILKEIRSKPPAKKTELGNGIQYLYTGGGSMSRNMNTHNGATVSGDYGGCAIGDLKEHMLVEVEENWGPQTFPSAAEKQGKVTSYQRLGAKGKTEQFRLLVDCRRPDLVRKSKLKKQFAMRVTLADRLDLSDRTRAALLTNAAKLLTSIVECRNEVTFPEPRSVDFAQ